MKSLRESLFDTDLIDSEYVKIEDWARTYLSFYYDDENYDINIDTKKKVILVKCPEYLIPILKFDGCKKSFNGFPKGYDFIMNDANTKVTRVEFLGKVDSLENWPKSIETDITFVSLGGVPIEIKPPAFKDLSKYNRKIKNISYFTSYGFSADFNGVDMSELTSDVQSIDFNSTIRCAQNCKVIFNPNMKVEKLSFGDQYHVLGIQNLPIIKSQLSFWGGRMEKIKTMINQLKDVGKTNFNKIKIFGSNLTADEKEEIRKMLLQEQGS